MDLEPGDPVMNAMPDWLLEVLTNVVMKDEDRKAGPGALTMRKLTSTLHYEGLLLAEMSGRLERFRAVSAEVLLREGSKGLPFLKPSLATLEQTLLYIAGLKQNGSNNPGQANRGSRPGLVVQELRRFLPGHNIRF